MLYLLDANVLIDANRDYYPIARVPEFWEWLEHNGVEDLVKIPVEIYEEINTGSDDLGKWAKQDKVREALLLDEEADVLLVSRVIDQGYASDLTDEDVEKIGRDPFLIAYALTMPSDRCVVTTERSKPRRKRANRHIPNVCADLRLRCLDTFGFVRELDFKTDWKSA